MKTVLLIVAAVAVLGVAFADDTTTANPKYKDDKVGKPLLSVDHAGVLRNPKSGKVLEASYNQVKLQDYTGFDSQMWYSEYIGAGKFRLRNKSHGLYMDVDGDVEDSAPVVVRRVQEGNPKQEWNMNSDKTITSSTEQGKYALDIQDGSYRSGTPIIMYTKHGKDNQQFNYQLN